MSKLFVVSFRPMHFVMCDFSFERSRTPRVIVPGCYPDSGIGTTMVNIIEAIPKNLTLVGFINEGDNQGLVFAGPDSLQVSDIRFGDSVDFHLLDKSIREVSAHRSLRSLASAIGSSLQEAIQAITPAFIANNHQDTTIAADENAVNSPVSTNQNPITSAEELRSMKRCSVALKAHALEEVSTNEARKNVEAHAQQLEDFKIIFDELYAPLNNSLEATIAFAKIELAHWDCFLDQRTMVEEYERLFSPKKLKTSDSSSTFVPRICEVHTLNTDTEQSAQIEMVFTLHAAHEVNQANQRQTIANHLVRALAEFHKTDVTYKLSDEAGSTNGVRLSVKFNAYKDDSRSLLDEEVREILAKNLLSRFASLVSITYINQPIGKNHSQPFSLFDQKLETFINAMCAAVPQTNTASISYKGKPIIPLKQIAESFKCYFSEVAGLINPDKYEVFTQVSRLYCEKISHANLFPTDYAQVAWLMLVTVLNMSEGDSDSLSEVIFRKIRSFETTNSQYKLVLIACGIAHFLKITRSSSKVDLVKLAQLITIAQSITSVVDETLLAKMIAALSKTCERIDSAAETKDRHLYTKLLVLVKRISIMRAEYGSVLTDIINFAKANKRDELLASAVAVLAEIDVTTLDNQISSTSVQALITLLRDQSLAIPAQRRNMLLDALTSLGSEPIATANENVPTKAKSRTNAKKSKNGSRAPVAVTTNEKSITVTRKSDAENLINILDTYVFPRKKFSCVVTSENMISVTCNDDVIGEECFSRLERLGLKKLEGKENCVRFLVDKPEFSHLKWQSHFKKVAERIAPTFSLPEKKSVKPTEAVNHDDDGPALKSQFVSLKGEELLRRVIAQFLKCDLSEVGKEWTEEHEFDNENRNVSRLRFAIRNANSGCNIKNKHRLNPDAVVRALIEAFGGKEFGDFYPRTDKQTDSRIPDVFVVDRQALIAALDNPEQYQTVADQFVAHFEKIEMPNRNLSSFARSTTFSYAPQPTLTSSRAQFDYAMWKKRFSHAVQQSTYGEGLSFHLLAIKNLLSNFDQSNDETIRKRIFRLYALHSFCVINLIFECERKNDSPMKSYFNKLRQSIRHALGHFNFEKLLTSTRHLFMALYEISLIPNFTHINCDESSIECSLRFFEVLIADFEKDSDTNSQRAEAESTYLQELVTNKSESDPLINYDIAVSCCVIHQTNRRSDAVGKLIAAVSGFIGHPIEAVVKHSVKGQYNFDQALNTVIEPLATKLTPVIASSPMK